VLYTWKCQSCGKRSQGFVVPYGKCYLCGGVNQVVEGYEDGAIASLSSIRDAVQFEVDMYHFYRMATAKVSDAEGREVLEDLYDREKDHLDELRNKYHLQLGDEVLAPSAQVEQVIEQELFAGVAIGGADQLRAIYEKALELEKRTYAFFADRARNLPDGPEKEICRELAAEEEEHVALIETELGNL